MGGLIHPESGRNANKSSGETTGTECLSNSNFPDKYHGVFFVYFSSSFIVGESTYRSFIHLELIIVYGTR